MMFDAERARKVTQLSTSAPNAVADLIIGEVTAKIKLHATFKSRHLLFPFPAGLNSVMLKLDAAQLAELVGQKLKRLGYQVKLKKKPACLYVRW